MVHFALIQMKLTEQVGPEIIHMSFESSQTNMQSHSLHVSFLSVAVSCREVNGVKKGRYIDHSHGYMMNMIVQ